LELIVIRKIKPFVEMVKKFFLLISVVSLLVSCTTTRELAVTADVVKAPSLGNATVNTVIYGLPQTAMKVEVTAVKRVKKAGPFYRYAEKYLNITNVVVEDQEEWVLKLVNVVPIGKADVSKLFAIRMSGPGQAQNVNLNREGVLCGINLSLFSEQPLPQPAFQSLPIIGLPEVNFSAVPMLEKQLIKTSTAAMAEEVANHIYKIRKRRTKILTADYDKLPPDGDAYAIVVDELNRLEKQFTELFVGKVEEQVVTRVFEYIPGKQGNGNNVLFRFSKSDGIVDKMDVTGTPVYIEVKDETVRHLPENEIKDSKASAKQGLFYCVPGKARVRVLDRTVLLFEQEMDVAQFGQLVSLPAGLLERKNVEIELSPVTGALIRVTERKR
jgi:hypothetical protein